MTPDAMGDSSMDMGTMSGNSSMMGMMMVFQNSMTTPLYSMSWTPTTQGQYAGTCIFLIVLAIISRILLAAKTLQEDRWLERELNRRYEIVPPPPAAETPSESDSPKADKAGLLPENGAQDRITITPKRKTRLRPWRLSVDPVRAVTDTVLAGVAYLLMLAVMTMNVGYFISVLGGIFLGSLIVGRYVHGVDHSMGH